MGRRSFMPPGVPVSGVANYQTYTPTVTVVGATLASAAGLFIRNGALLSVWGVVNCTTGATGTLSISIPAGFSAVQSIGFPINVGMWAPASPAGANVPSALGMTSGTTFGALSLTANTSQAYAWFAQILLVG